MELKGSKTEQNLLTAFAGESQAHVKYQYYASAAKKEGYNQIGAIFSETAGNEKEHAKLWFKALHGGAVPKTMENLRDAADGENYEWNEMYAEFAKTAKEEGIEHIAGLFENIENIEKIHYERLRKVILKLKDDAKPNPDGTFNWACSVCGGVFVQKEEPDYCPLCVKEDVFFYKKVD